MVKRRFKNSRKGRISKQKRSLFQFASVLILITFAIIIQGCAPTPEPETERTLSTALEVFEPPTFKCNDEVPQICRATSRDNLSLTVEVPEQKDGKSVTVIDLPFDKKEKAEVLKARSPFEITRLVASFEVRDAKTNQVITDEFIPPLELRLEFTAEQWEEWTSVSGLDQPRLAYLVRKENGWSDEWQEFKNVKGFQPGEHEKYPDSGVLEIQIDNWGDPLIGGT